MAHIIMDRTKFQDQHQKMPSDKTLSQDMGGDIDGSGTCPTIFMAETGLLGEVGRSYLIWRGLAKGHPQIPPHTEAPKDLKLLEPARKQIPFAVCRHTPEVSEKLAAPGRAVSKAYAISGRYTFPKSPALDI